MKNLIKILCILSVLCGGIIAQTTPPKPSAPKTVKIPAVKEMTLKNGLKVAVVERKNVPLVTVQLLVKTGAGIENMDEAGLANMTAGLLTKGTKTRSATDIAEQMEFLGGSIESGAGWNNSFVFVNVMSDKLPQALAIMSDAVLNPAFKQDELDLLKSQTLDGLTYNLTQPGFLTNYVASAYTYGEHPAGGTPASINAMTRDKIVGFHKNYYIPNDSVLIFTGDITAAQANKLAMQYFGKWKKVKINVLVLDEIPEPPDTVTAENRPPTSTMKSTIGTIPDLEESSTTEDNKEPPKLTNIERILVIDLPNSGQASVSYAKMLVTGRTSYDDKDNTVVSENYFPSIVLNSVLGGGYSSRLNQEIRIKRGLSYGAGSSFGFRDSVSNFGTRTQTKNVSAAEVAELVLTEIRKLEEGKIPSAELDPRKLVLTGGFGRNLETNNGLAGAVADLYSFNLPTTLLNSYMSQVEKVSDAQIQKFAGENLSGGDLIIVGDYNVFKDDLAKRFPDMTVDVIKADDLDITQETLRKK